MIRSALRSLVLFGLLLAAIPEITRAQQAPPAIPVAAEGEVQEIELRDGSTLYGSVLEVGVQVRIRLVSGGEVMLPPEEIRSVRRASGRVVEGRFRPSDPNDTRLFFGPTGRLPAAGSGYLAVYELYIPFVAWSPTDRFLISGGTPLFGIEWDDRPYWIAPKFAVLEREDLSVAAGAIALVVEDETAGILFASATKGSADRSLTGGIGYGWVNGDLADSPALMLGGEVRTGDWVKLVTENYLLPGNEVLLSAGTRFFGRRLSADLGLVFPVTFESSIEFFPLVNFVWTW